MKNLMLTILIFSISSSTTGLTKENNLTFPSDKNNQTVFLTSTNPYNFTTTNTDDNHAIVSGINGDLEIWSDQKNKKVNQNISLTQFKFTSPNGYVLEGLETINLNKGTRNFMIGSNDGFIEFEQFINVNIKNKSLTNNEEKPWVIKTNLFSMKSIDLLEEYKNKGINIEDMEKILKEHIVFSKETSYKAYSAIQLLGNFNSSNYQKDFAGFQACVSSGFSLGVSYLAYLQCAACAASEGLIAPACNSCAMQIGATVLALTSVMATCSSYLPDLIDYPSVPPVLDPNSPDGYNGSEGYTGSNRIPIYGEAVVCSDDVCWTVKVVVGYIYLLY